MSKNAPIQSPTSSELAELIAHEQALCDDISRKIAKAESDAAAFVVLDQEKYALAVEEVKSLSPEVAAKTQRLSYLRRAHGEALSKERDQEIIQLRFDTWKAVRDMNRRYGEMAEEKEELKRRYEESCRQLDHEDREIHNRVSSMTNTLHGKLRQKGLDPQIHGVVTSTAPPPMDRVAI